MAAVARGACEGFANVRVEVASFQDWPPEAAAFHLVFAAQSGHWVDREVRSAKFHGRLPELFSRDGLVVEHCFEPTMGPGPGLSGRVCQGFVGDHLTGAAWTGVPIGVVWQLRRTGGR